ncbi:MAG: HAD hydrolase-like protein [Patescibacteria group bacterium]|jgi:FMN phosphatase YigB (HAD superfamily)|nr:HAD hydrolase-like protein [Patescibacteria group bacterium]
MKKNEIKLIIFDAYGAVMSRGYPDTMAVLAKRFAIPEKKLSEVIYRKYFEMAAQRQITQKQAWQLPVKELNLPISWQELRDLHYGLMEINQPVFEIAKKLRKKYKVIILSKSTRTQFVDVLKKKHPQVPRNFDAIVNTWELGLPKASKETISFLAKRFKISPKEILYIDDQRSNLVALDKMGGKTIYYQNFKQFKKELEHYIDL